MPARLAPIVLALVVAACEGGAHGGRGADAGPPSEGGLPPPRDAAIEDASDALDATPPDDAGEPDDAPVDRPDARPSGPAACESGGETAGSGGAEGPFGEAVVGLCRMAIGCPATWALAPPPESYRTRGTPNHKLLWRVWYYGWAQRAGTAADVDDARAFLVSFFDAQRTYGHEAISDGANEVLNTSHYQIWANGMTCARLLAVVHDDAPLRDATGAWWRGEAALYDALRRGGTIDAPGARFKDGQQGPSQLRDVIDAMIEGRPLGGRPGDASSPWWDDYYNVAAWTLREVLRTGDDLGAAASVTAADIPLLSDPLVLRDRGDDFVFFFPRLRGALEPLFWVAHVGGTTTYAPYTPGTPVDSATMPPDLPGATERVLAGRP